MIFFYFTFLERFDSTDDVALFAAIWIAGPLNGIPV
jgi:hypothetical protein